MRSVRLVVAGFLILAAVLLAGVTITRGFFYSPETEIPISPQAIQEMVPAISAQDHPARLIIPAIGVNAPIEKAGIVAGNRMAAPKKFANAAWFKYGTVPGFPGSAVIAGHLDNGFGLKGVFKRVEELSPGDEIIVETESGTKLYFSVEKRMAYPLREVPSDVFTADDAIRLNLVTCDGKLIKTQKEGWTYNERLVVYAVFREST